jgi:hypothetical protein
MAVDLVKGDFDVADDTGSGGPAAISASTYGYQSVNLSDGEVTVEEWVAANPDAKWVVEVYRDGEIIHQVATDSANATGYNQIQAPDGSRQYGNGVWWARVIAPEDFQVGDVWKVYGWNDMGENIPAYPPDRT